MCIGRTLALLATAVSLCAQQPAPHLEPNVIYGMYSGLALLIDVYHPDKPNGYGVVFIAGSGWGAPQQYGAEPISKGVQIDRYSAPLLAAGYTVFSISHRAAPRFRYPAAVEDAQRAVRFIRHNADQYKIVRADRIGAAGLSSGGHLVLLLGTLNGSGNSQDADPVERESAKVQCVVAIAGTSDLARGANFPVVSFMGMMPPPNSQGDTIEARSYRQASPINHVTRDAAPVLLMHGDADRTVPFEQSVMMEKALKQAGVATRLLRIPGGAHGPTFRDPPNPPDFMGEMVRWFDQHLRKAN